MVGQVHAGILHMLWDWPVSQAIHGMFLDCADESETKGREPGVVFRFIDEERVLGASLQEKLRERRMEE
jgi:hypothetical protein